MLLTTEAAPRPKLYFVEVDVQACFDTIEQSKLLQILRDVLSEVRHTDILRAGCIVDYFQDNYVLPRFGQVMQAAGKVKRKFAMKALPDGRLFYFIPLRTVMPSCRFPV
jgi:telomerase reverse transcriptase